MLNIDAFTFVGLDFHTKLSKRGEYAKEKGVDALYCTGPLSKETSDGFNGNWYETKDEIYEAVKPLLDQDCIVLIKGSRAMKMDTLVDAFRGEKQ